MSNKAGHPKYPKGLGEKWARQYVEEEKSCGEIAEQCSYHPSVKTVEWRLNKMGVRLRNYREASQVRLKHGRNPIIMLNGQKAINWKGGKHTRDGYVLIYRPNHPRCKGSGYIYEHIVVWEENHKRRLPEGWIIHHLNGIKDDNRPMNLVAYPRLKHERLIPYLLTKLRELELENAALRNGQSIFLRRNYA